MFNCGSTLLICNHKSFCVSDITIYRTGKYPAIVKGLQAGRAMKRDQFTLLTVVIEQHRTTVTTGLT